MLGSSMSAWDKHLNWMRRVTNGGARRILANGLAVASRRESIFQGGIGESRC